MLKIWKCNGLCLDYPLSQYGMKNMVRFYNLLITNKIYGNKEFKFTFSKEGKER